MRQANQMSAVFVIISVFLDKELKFNQMSAMVY